MDTEGLELDDSYRNNEEQKAESPSKLEISGIDDDETFDFDQHNNSKVEEGTISGRLKIGFTNLNSKDQP